MSARNHADESYTQKKKKENSYTRKFFILHEVVLVGNFFFERMRRRVDKAGVNGVYHCLNGIMPEGS